MHADRPTTEHDPHSIDTAGNAGSAIPATDGLIAEAGYLTGVSRIAGLVLPPASEPLEGHDLGGIRLVRLLGEGGMGRVYEGFQAQPRRRVAVKLLRMGLINDAMLRQFEREGVAAGRLRHPAVAAVYSVGSAKVAGDVVPYLVMELVEGGRSLTAYCRERRLNLRDRLALFRQVCEAVAHAHQRGIIHRDLKPANILVDDEGRPKVIDFGVAKFMAAPDMGQGTLTTLEGRWPGTPQYMPPEQFQAANEVDARSDVYALGVVLYELLTGRLPYEVRGLGPVETAQMVRDADPPAPSLFNPLVDRPITAVVATCLAKDPGARYGTVAELVAEVGCWLAGEPVRALPPRWSDTIYRFARRHRAAAVAGGSIVLAGVVALIGISLFAVDAVRARRAAEADRGRASAALDYVTGVFRLWDPLTDGRQVTAAQLLDRAVAASIGTFSGDPDTQARILFALGRSALALGRHETARLALRACVDLPRPRTALEPTLGAALANLAQATQAGGDLESAALLFERALEELRFTMGDDHQDTLLTAANLASLEHRLGKPAGAVDRLEALLPLVRRRQGIDSADSLSLETNQALALIDVGRVGEAESLLASVLERRKRLLGDSHTDTLLSYRNLGGCLARAAKFAEALAPLEAAHAGLRERFGRLDQNAILTAYDLAIVLEAAGRPGEAIPLLGDVLASVKELHGPNSAQAREVAGRLERVLERAED